MAALPLCYSIADYYDLSDTTRAMILRRHTIERFVTNKEESTALRNIIAAWKYGEDGRSAFQADVASQQPMP